MGKNRGGRPRKHRQALTRTTVPVPDALITEAKIWGLRQTPHMSFNDVVMLALERLTKGAR